MKIDLPLPRAIRLLRNLILLDIGGITFSDGRAMQLLYNVFTIWPAMLLHVPVIKLSQAMGPFNTTLNRKLAAHFLPKCHKIFTRGSMTDSYTKQLIGTNNTEQAADIAFLYDEYSLSKAKRRLKS